MFLNRLGDLGSVVFISIAFKNSQMRDWKKLKQWKLSRSED